MKDASQPWPLLAAIIAFAIGTALTHVSIVANFDGWAYWQGAVSLLEGRGYTFFSGEPIVSWPPLYSIYLAAWIAIGGATTSTVALANTVLVSLQAGLWCWLALELCRTSGRTPGVVAGATIAVYLGLFLPLYQTSVRAEPLLYALLPGFLLAAWRMAHAARPAGRQVAAAAVLAILMTLTHHRAFVFIATAALLVGMRVAGEPAKRRELGRAGALMVAAPAVAWLVARTWLGQWDSHVVAATAGRDSTLNYARQFVGNLGRMLSAGTVEPPRLAVIAFVLVLGLVAWRQGKQGPLRALILFAAIASALTFATFEFVYLDDDLDARFILFAPALLVPALVAATDAAATWIRASVTAMVLIPLLLGAPAAIALAQNPHPEDTGEVLVHPARISIDYPEGPDVPEPGGRLVAPNMAREADPRIRRQRDQGLRR
jgi:hypothetical protein